jgi:hypothetical protein
MVCKVATRDVSLDSSEAERLQGQDDRWITTAFVSCSDPNELARKLRANISGQSGRLQKWGGGYRSRPYRERFQNHIGEILSRSGVIIYAISCQEITLRHSAEFLAIKTGYSLINKNPISGKDACGTIRTLNFDLSLPTQWIAFFTHFFKEIEFEKIREIDSNIELLEWFIAPDIFGTDNFDNPVRLDFYVQLLDLVGIPSRYVFSFKKNPKELHPIFAIADNFAGFLNSKIPLAYDNNLDSIELDSKESYVWYRATHNDSTIELNRVV